MAERSVAVIGMGIVGACLGLVLQRRGHRVTFIDPKPPGEGASYGNAGCFNGSSIVPVAMPGVLRNVPSYLLDRESPLSIRWSYLPQVAPWLVRFVRAATPDRVAAQATALRSLLGPTVPMMTDLAAEAGATDLVRHEGHLYVYRSEAGFAKDAAGWQLRRDNGVRLEIVGQRELCDLDPALSHELVKGVLIPENGHTPDPSGLVRALVGHAIRQGAAVEAAAAAGFRLAGSQLTHVVTSRGEVAADAAVVVAGAHSKPLARLAGDDVPLDTERGYHVVIRDPEARPRIPITEAEGKFVANPMNAGLRLAGTVELGGLSLAPDYRRARMMLDQARRLFPGLAPHHPEERLSLWMGFRPSLPDSLPVIGRSSASPDILYGFGHGHVGMTAAPMTAHIVGDLLDGRTPDIDVSPFLPTRFR